MAKLKTAAERRKPIAERMDAESLGKLLAEASVDDKAEAQRRLMDSLRPVLLELMKNKGWSSRKTASFLKSRNIKVKALEIDALLRLTPFCAADHSTLAELKANQPLEPNAGVN